MYSEINERRDDMNKHVLLVLKWIKNPDSVTRKELDEHYDSLEYPVFHGSPEYAIDGAFDSMENVYIGGDNNVELWINEYFRLSGENRTDYEKEI